MAYNTDINRQDGIVHGGAVWSGSGLVFDISHVVFIKNGKDYSVGPNQLTLAAADPSEARIDVIVVDINGSALVIEGTPSATPVKPEIDFETQEELTFVVVGAGALTPTDISVDAVYLENVGDPTEWDAVATIVGAGSWAVNSGVDPFSGSISMNATSVVEGDLVDLTTATPVSTASIGILELRIKLKAPLLNHAGTRLAFYNGVSRVSDWVTLDDAGINIWNTNYQLVSISNSAFNITTPQVDGLRIEVMGAGGHNGFFIDQIQIHSGISIPGGDDYFTVSSGVASIQIQLGQNLEFESSDSSITFDLSGGKVGIVAKNWFKDDLIQTGNRIHDQAGYSTTINGVGTLILNNPTALSPALELNQHGAFVVPALEINADFQGIVATRLAAGSSPFVHLVATSGSGALLRAETSVTGSAIQAINTGVFGSAPLLSEISGATSTNSALTLATFRRLTTGVAANSIGVRLNFEASREGGSSDIGTLNYIFTDVLVASMTGQAEIRLRNAGAAAARKFAITGPGQMILDAYGDGTFDGTPTRLAGWDASGNVLEINPATFGIPINNLLLASGSNTINNAAFQQEWQWNTLAGAGLTLSSTSTAAAGNLQNILAISLSGANATASQTTYGVTISNAHTGTSSTNVGISVSASGGTVNWGGRFTANGSNNTTGVAGFSDLGVAVLGESSGTGIGVRGHNTSTGRGGEFISLNGVPISGNDYTTLTNNVTTLLQLTRTTSGTVALGFGASIRFRAETDDGSHVVHESGQLRFVWSDVVNATRTSYFELYTTNSATSARKLAILGNGKMILDEYGAGTFSGTETYLLASDASGNIIEVAPTSLSARINKLLAADGTNTINNANYAQEWQWNTLAGGTGLKLSSTSTAAASDLQRVFEISLSGVNANSSQSTYAGYFSNIHTGSSSTNYGIFGIANGGTINYGVYGSSAASGSAGVGVRGNADAGLGVLGSSDTGSGVQGSSNSGNGLSGISNTGVAIIGTKSGSGTNAIETALRIVKNTTGTAANGIGVQMEFQIETATDASVHLSAYISSLWTDAITASRTSALDFYTVNSAVSARKMRLAGNGQLTVDEYGAGTFSGTETYLLASDASGNIIEVDPADYNNPPAGSNDPSVTATDSAIATTVNLSAVATGHHVHIGDCATAIITYDLPDAASSTAMFTFKKIDGSANVLRLDGDSLQTIDGSTTFDVAAENESFTIVSDGSNWRVISHYAG